MAALLPPALVTVRTAVQQCLGVVLMARLSEKPAAHVARFLTWLLLFPCADRFGPNACGSCGAGQAARGSLPGGPGRDRLEGGRTTQRPLQRNAAGPGAHSAIDRILLCELAISHLHFLSVQITTMCVGVLMYGNPCPDGGAHLRPAAHRPTQAACQTTGPVHRTIRTRFVTLAF